MSYDYLYYESIQFCTIDEMRNRGSRALLYILHVTCRDALKFIKAKFIKFKLRHDFTVWYDNTIYGIVRRRSNNFPPTTTSCRSRHNVPLPYHTSLFNRRSIFHRTMVCTVQEYFVVVWVCGAFLTPIDTKIVGLQCIFFHNFPLVTIIVSMLYAIDFTYMKQVALAEI